MRPKQVYTGWQNMYSRPLLVRRQDFNKTCERHRGGYAPCFSIMLLRSLYVSYVGSPNQGLKSALAGTIKTGKGSRLSILANLAGEIAARYKGGHNMTRIIITKYSVQAQDAQALVG
jgi:hypothetical protein